MKRTADRFTWRTLVRIIFLILFLVLIALGKFQLWLIVYGVGVLASFVFGRIYCAYSCPMHTVMRPVSSWSRKLGIQRKRVPAWLQNHRWAIVVLMLAVGSMIVAKRLGDFQVPVFPMLFALSLIVTMFLPDAAWHKGLCPYSVLLAFTARFARFSHGVDTSSCARTRICERTCPAGAITMDGPDATALIDKRFCLQCELCGAACPKNAISYTKGKKPVV